jgi:hypothetical protein
MSRLTPESIRASYLTRQSFQRIGERNPTVEELSHPAGQRGTLEDMESEDYASNQGSVRPKASI